jgi:hypothetical protein
MESYSLFQFAVDNASSVERSVALLLNQHPTQPDWVLQYFRETRHSLISFGFFVEYMRSVETEADLEQFQTLLQAAEIVPDRWLLKAACDQYCRLRQPTMLAEQSELHSACDTRCPKILEALLEIPGAVAAIDNWICVYVCEVQELLDVLLQKREEKMYSDV